MVMLRLPSCLDNYPSEAGKIGELILRYGEIEYMVCRVVSLFAGDFNASLKAMYNIRGELSRLKIADALATVKASQTDLSHVYDATMEGVETCRQLRNSYAHAHWMDVLYGKLGFYDLEKIARRKGPVHFLNMDASLLDAEIIDDQIRFFAEVLHNLTQLMYELDARDRGGWSGQKFILPLREPRRARPAKINYVADPEPPSKAS